MSPFRQAGHDVNVPDVDFFDVAALLIEYLHSGSFVAPIAHNISAR